MPHITLNDYYCQHQGPCESRSCNCQCIENGSLHNWYRLHDIPDSAYCCDTDGVCGTPCSEYCYNQHADSSAGSLPPQQLGSQRRRQPYTPGRGRRGRRGASTKSVESWHRDTPHPDKRMTPGMSNIQRRKGGRANTNSRFSGRSQNNPKGKSK